MTETELHRYVNGSPPPRLSRTEVLIFGGYWLSLVGWLAWINFAPLPKVVVLW